MERKILWAISFALIFVLWLKIDPSDTSPSQSSSAIKSVDKDIAASAPILQPEKANDTIASNKITIESSAKDKKSEATKIVAESDEEDPLPGSSEEEKAYFQSHPIKTNKPNFAAISDVKTRKEAFFNYLTPFVREKNNLILEDRTRLKELLDNLQQAEPEDIQWINKQRKMHKLSKEDQLERHHIETLLVKLDVIPASLVLAQAANESAWGTSRFALEGNNYFGQWCFRKGCGLIPSSRSEGADHEVRKFTDARQSVFAYIDNLNSNAAYKELRAIRADLRSRSLNISGKALASGLIRYSQRGQAYVDEIEGLIQYNRLWRFNREIDGYVSTALNN